MTEDKDLGRVQIPSYAEIFDELVTGFGLVESQEGKLSSQRSWQGKQSRYGPKDDQPWRGENRGLIGEFVMLLSGNDLKIAGELANFLHNVETGVSHLGGTALFTRKPYRYGIKLFLALFAFPQIAQLLRRLRGRLPLSSPLYHLSGLLPAKDQLDYDSAAVTRNAVRRLLDGITEISTTDFRRSLSKVSSKSDVMLKNIEKQIDELRDEAKGRDEAESLFQRINAVRATYIAGMAVQRFLGRLTREFSFNAAGFLGLINYHMESIEAPGEHAGINVLSDLHATLFKDLSSNESFFIEELFNENSALLRLQQWFEQHLELKFPEECYPLISALELFDNETICIPQIAEKLNLLKQHEDFEVFEPYYDYVAAHLNLAQNHVVESLKKFDSVLNHCATQQLGDLAVDAARYAIALKLMSPGKWINGCLDPLVAHLAKNKVQEFQFEVGMPTPFKTFSDIPEHTGSTKLIFESIHFFNSAHRPNTANANRLVCNPLASLERYMTVFFARLDMHVSQGAKELDSIETSVAKAFSQTAKSRSVFRTHHVVPYEAIRDIIFYTNKFFDEMAYFVHESMNPSIHRYILMPPDFQLLFLKSLDPSEFERDSLN